MKLIDVGTFRAAAKRKQPSKDPVWVAHVGEPKAYEDGSRKIRFCFSDGSVDRMGDTIDPAGWVTHGFMRNPVALFAHDSSSPPIGTASSVMVEDLRLMGDIEFATPEIYAFADTIYRLLVAKFLRAVSVGFLPLEYEWAEEDDREWGLDFKKQELLEISVVPVPANGNALAEARSKGIDTRPLVEWAEKTLDGGGKVIIPRTELQRLRAAAKEVPMTRVRAAAKPGARRRADDTETDPEAAAATGNCGRPIGDECGMKDVAECSIHGQTGAGMAGDDDEEKRIARIVARSIGPAVSTAISAALKAAGIKPRRKADDDKPEEVAEGEGEDDRPDLSPDHEKSMRLCSMHMKAMGTALEVAGDHHDEATKAMDSVMDALDASPPPGEGSGEGEQNPEAKAITRQRRIEALRARAQAA